MTEEEQRMAVAVKSRTKAALDGRQEGIRALYLTASKKEFDQFDAQNEMLSKKGTFTFFWLFFFIFFYFFFMIIFYLFVFIIFDFIFFIHIYFNFFF